MMPVLEYQDNNDDKSVWWFLDKSLQLNKAPVLRMLSMELGPQCPTDADVGKWVEKAVDRRVGLLILELLWSADPTSLPKKLYSCESLHTLSLSDKILVDVPSTPCLPSLIDLYLDCVVYKNEDSLVRFLSSCPVLNYLFVKREKDDNVKRFTVKVPSLLKLKYINYSSGNDVEDTGRCLVVDTPALKVFEFTDCSGDSCSIEGTPCFKKVSINFFRSFPDIDKFLRSFSAVSFLELELVTHEMILCWTTIRFSRLTMCKIRPWYSNWMHSLVPFLENTPKLKFLRVDYKLTNPPPPASALWSEPGNEPGCLSSSLEKFELIDYTRREEEQTLVEYILTTSRCLKTATISFRSLPDLKLEDKEAMMDEFKAIPRVSKTSQLLFKT